MRLHEHDGGLRSAVDLLQEFQGRWEWSGELATANGWGALDEERVFSALAEMWDDWRAMMTVVLPELGLNERHRPAPMQPRERERAQEVAHG